MQLYIFINKDRYTIQASNFLPRDYIRVDYCGSQKSYICSYRHYTIYDDTCIYQVYNFKRLLRISLSRGLIQTETPKMQQF